MNRELLTAFDAEIQKLITLLPIVHRAVGDLKELEDEPRWRRLRENADALALRKLPVVTLVGPTGSGKSTLFRLLSGVDVPSGGAVRPNTHNCAVAVPHDITETELCATFPSSQLRPLEDLNELRNPRLSRETLFFRTMSPQSATRGDFLLCDVPDFNAVCMENWEKAKLMIGRSEVVIFVVHKISYANYTTMLYLARTCAHAAHLAYVITKAKRDEACEIHADLVERKSAEFRLKNDDLSEDAALPFAESRTDGQNRGEFLAKADFYFSEERKEPQLEEIHALADGAPPLANLLRGHNIARLMLTKRANDIQQGLLLVDATLAAHGKRLSDLQQCRSAVLKQLEDVKLDVVGAQLPLGDVLQNVIHEAESALPTPIKLMIKLANMPLELLHWIGEGIASWLRKLKDLISDKENVQPLRRDLIEREALRDRCERLANDWRADHSRALKLSAESCVAAIRDFEGQPVPEPDTEWHDYAAQRACTWVKENPKKAALLLAGGGVFGLLAPVAVTVDLFTTGGLVTIEVSTWTAIGGAAGGSLAIAALLDKLIEKLGMERLVKDFQLEWKEQRNRQLRAHLHEHFGRPLVLDILDQRIAALTKAPAAECAHAVNALRRVLAENLLASIS
jgi:energy-coupling factor transporter ATP-binding protein EcfA2